MRQQQRRYIRMVPWFFGVCILMLVAMFLSQIESGLVTPPHLRAVHESQLVDDSLPVDEIFITKSGDATEDNHREGSSATMHALFLGDSVTRYSFLSLAYFIHTSRVDVPTFLINEKRSRNFIHYFQRSTRFFGGSMSCDCYRMTTCSKLDKVCKQKWSQTAFENRQYRHPHLPVVLTFMQVWGDLPLIASIDPWLLHNGNITDVPRKHTYRLTLLEFLKTVVPKLVPRVTSIALNTGMWEHSHTLASIQSILEALSSAANMSVWQETSPDRRAMIMKPSTADNDFSRDISNNSRIEGKSNNGTSSSGRVLSDIDAAAQRLCAPQGRLDCVFAPFPVKISSMNSYTDWWDDKHLNAKMHQQVMSDVWHRMVNTTSLKAHMPRYPPLLDSSFLVHYENASNFGLKDSLELRKREKPRNNWPANGKRNENISSSWIIHLHRRAQQISRRGEKD